MRMTSLVASSVLTAGFSLGLAAPGTAQGTQKVCAFYDISVSVEKADENNTTFGPKYIIDVRNSGDCQQTVKVRFSESTQTVFAKPNATTRETCQQFACGSYEGYQVQPRPFGEVVDEMANRIPNMLSDDFFERRDALSDKVETYRLERNKTRSTSPSANTKRKASKKQFCENQSKRAKKVLDRNCGTDFACKQRVFKEFGEIYQAQMDAGCSLVRF